MIIDSSVWVDFARGINGNHVAALENAVRAGIAMTTDIVRLEVLCGKTDVPLLAAALDGCRQVEQLPRVDVENAAEIFRMCRRAGETVRSANGCLIAAIALRRELAVLHNDRDFDAIAVHTGLRAVRA